MMCTKIQIMIFHLALLVLIDLMSKFEIPNGYNAKLKLERVSLQLTQNPGGDYVIWNILYNMTTNVIHYGGHVKYVTI